MDSGLRHSLCVPYATIGWQKATFGGKLPQAKQRQKIGAITDAKGDQVGD